jgi:hypothetical protein
MTCSNVAKGAAVVALLSFAPTGLGAMPIISASPSGRPNMGLIQTVAQILPSAVGRLHGARSAHAKRATDAERGTAVNRSGSANRNARAEVNVNRNVRLDGDRPGLPAYKPPTALGGGWARPDWYRWTPGGAIAAGVALGFVTAATATWANPPQPGLCWFYTDPSQQDGFWDACP